MKTTQDMREAQNKVVSELQADSQSVYEQIQMRDQYTLWSFYFSLKCEYEKNKIEYNFKSPTISKKERLVAYQTLIYKQGCLKMFEFSLGLDKAPQEGYVNPKT